MSKTYDTGVFMASISHLYKSVQDIDSRITNLNIKPTYTSGKVTKVIKEKINSHYPLITFKVEVADHNFNFYIVIPSVKDGNDVFTRESYWLVKFNKETQFITFAQKEDLRKSIIHLITATLQGNTTWTTQQKEGES